MGASRLRHCPQCGELVLVNEVDGEPIPFDDECKGCGADLQALLGG